MIDKRIWRLLIVLAGFDLTGSTTALDNSIITSTDFEEMDGPIISLLNSTVILNKGQNFTIHCKGKRELKFKQQEIPEEVIGPFYMVQRNVTSSGIDQDFEIALDLYNVDQFAVGFYACYDNTLNDSAVLNNIIEEPHNTAHVSYVYVFVNGSDSLFAPMREVVIARTGSKIVIECRPTAPDIKVNLVMSQSNKKSDNIKYSPKIGFLVKPRTRSEYKCEAERGNQTFAKRIWSNMQPALPPKPQITGGLAYFLNGETFSLNCTIVYQKNSAVMLSWIIPITAREKVINETNEHDVTDGILYYNLTVVNATKEDAGTYTCLSRNGYKKEDRESFSKIYLEKPFINMVTGTHANPLEVKQKTVRLKVMITEYPPSKYIIYRNNKYFSTNDSKFHLSKYVDGLTLLIRNLTVTDSANYTIVADNSYVTKNVTFDVRIKAVPIVDFAPENNKRYLENTHAVLLCEAIGYPLPDIRWIFSNDQEYIVNGRSEMESVYKVISTLEIPVHASGNITCEAKNTEGTTSSTRPFLVYEMPDGFGIKNVDRTWFSEDQTVILKCLASKYDFKNVTWYKEDEEVEYSEFVEYSDNTFSHVAKLKIDQISLEDAGNYTCFGIRNDESNESETITITVAARRSLAIKAPKIDKDEEVYLFQPVNLTCQADAVPPPTIEWYKDGVLLVNDSDNIEIIMEHLNHTIVNSSIQIKRMKEENRGKYECYAKSHDVVKTKFYNLILKENSPYKLAYLSIIGVIIFILIILVVYLAWKIRKEKRFRKELAAAGLLYFKEGHMPSLNPELGIDEQAELLPYDEKFEFPAEKLLLGKQLGAGAFGVVYKAEARGIINAEENTTVAVKMVKKTADNMYIKALASELKIMVHLGKHINIVNLLGACTKNVGKRELIVIVEYCKFGNIHNYMQKHREVFIDQLTDSKEKNLGKVNRGFSYSNGSNSDYFGSNHSQETDHTFLNTANTNRSGRKVSETGYVQPEWRSNYESDYSFDGRTPRPLCSRDLLAWAFQIARGMEYLASRKILHGDLAARNVLLAEDNIVKICDFGLARSIYKNDEYQKKENSPLPVKWLAIECMTDRIFSTQSDVWSFGIVLWELFSLAKTPYPNISPPSLLQWLSEGHRLEKPPHADDRLYEVMLQCWEQKPTARPSFSQLQEKLGSFLEDNVRNHYVDLNSAYMDTNIKRDSQEDYLAMVCAPDYNNLVTPSPHHYVNDTRSFFPPTPTQLQHDDEGYLQMSPASKQNIFSPRAPNTKFDFDTRKKNPTESEASSHGSELTPMLTLNNLPARSGSESDHEGNSSPYLNMCPRIEEESDEVFVIKQNNLKNVQNGAVTNPTYITFDVGLEKKPQDINNKYMNISTPNGLVK